MVTFKAVYNDRFGGFSLSDAALSRLRELGAGANLTARFDPLPRHDQRLVRVVKELGEAAEGRFTKLRIREISEPYRIVEYDGWERVETASDLADEWISPEVA